MPSRRRSRPAQAVDCRILSCEHSTKRSRVDAPSPSPSWSSMHDDLVGLIAEKVLAGDLLDYVRFRAACPQWRACSDDPRGRGVSDPRFHPRRWMMLPEGHGLHPGHTRLRGLVRFFNCDTGAFVSARIPELKDHSILDSPSGLLLLQRDADTAVRLLHPFTGDVVDLPPLMSLLPQIYQLHPNQLWLDGDENNLSRYRCLTAAVSVAPATGVVTVLLAPVVLTRFAHASLGDRTWALTTWSVENVRKPLAFHGSLYLMSRLGGVDWNILRLDPPLLEDGSSSVSLSPPKKVASFPAKLMILPLLVECNEEILVVGSTDMSRSCILAIRLADLLGGGSAAPLTSIGDHCLFFGNRSLAVSSKGLPGIAGNTIILCCSIPDRLMQYNLGDGTSSLGCDGDITRTPPPSPHSIVHHLVTCTFRYFWNKGLIYCARTNPRWRAKRKWRLGV